MNILVLQPQTGVREFYTAVLRAAGHRVEVPSRLGGVDAAAITADVIVVDVEIAAARGWLDGGVASPGAAVILTSAFEALLAPWRHAFATLRGPVTPARLLAAVSPLLDATASGEADSSPLEVDWSERDARLHDAGLDVGALGAGLDDVVRLVTTSARAPMALVTLVTAEQQHFLGQAGLPEDLGRAGATPRAWSFCQHVVAADAPLVVSDARRHPALASTALVETGLIRAYAGVPLRAEGIGVIGSVCVLSDQPREFSSEDLAMLELAAKVVEERIAASRASASGSGSAPKPPSGPAPRMSTTQVDSPASGLADRPSLVGTLLDGKYWITSLLGAGGMSEVFLARDRTLGNLVAIKVLHEGADDAVLLREARMLAAIRHPSIVQVHGWGWLGAGVTRRVYLVLEYVRGVPLTDRLQATSAGGEALGVEEITRILGNLAGALDTMHGAGLLHGDVKPANVILDAALDRAVLIDFGLAMRLPRGDEPEGAAPTCGGTPGYSAPEQLDKSRPLVPSPRLDVYSLAALGYALLVGRGPFSSLPMAFRSKAQAAGRYVPATEARPSLPAAVDVELARALDPAPERRHGSSAELVDALSRALLGATAASDEGAWAPTLPLSRGKAFELVRRTVSARVGSARDAELVAGLAPEDQAVLAFATDADDLYPTRALAAYLRAFAAGDGARLTDLGAAIGAATLPELLRRLQLGRSPYTFLRAIGPILHRFHNWGRIELTQASEHRARVHLHLPAALAPELCALIGGVMRALVSLAAGRATVVQGACAADGGEACVFDVSWPAG